MTAIRRPTQVDELDCGPIEYRLDRRGHEVVLVLHGGHLRAGLALGEDELAAAGFTVLAPSRPGYGRTPLRIGPTPARFADAVAALCTRLGITRVAAVVGISGGGPWAVTLAARHPQLVQRLVLISAVGFRPWPDRRTRVGAHIGFRPGVEAVTWAGIRLLLRASPAAALRLLLGGVSTGPGAAVAAGLRPDERDTVVALFSAMRSGHGFVNDLRPTPDVTAGVSQPTLVIATRADGGVPFTHAESLAAGIRDAELVESHAASHLVWFARDWPAIAARVTAFLAAPPSAAPPVEAAAPEPDEPTAPVSFHRPLRIATAALAAAGALLAAGTAGPAFAQLSVGPGLTFVAVAAGLTVLATGVLRQVTWLTRVAVLGLVGQPIVAAGALWQVLAGVPASKAAELRQLGVAPAAGAWINLGYGAVGAVLFCWLLMRWWRLASSP